MHHRDPENLEGPFTLAQTLVDLSKAHGSAHIDELCLHSKWAQGKVAGLLLNMEFNGVVRSLPGKVYRLN